MKKLNNIISIFVLILMFSGCNKDFLDLNPLDKVGETDFFKSPNDLKIYLNQFYNFYVSGEYGSDIGTDNAIYKTVSTWLDGQNTLDEAGSPDFGPVRRINYFFDNYKSVEANANFSEYKQYVGEAYFFKASIYFNLLQNYGNIQWYNSVLSTDSPELYNNRDPRNILADNIIACLDTAALYLTADRTDGASRLNKWMALHLQSSVALYEGTWEKYHNGDPFGVSNPQPDKYFNKAVEAATAIINSDLYDIYSTGKPTEDYYDLFATLRTYAQNSEVLFWKEYNNELGKGETVFRRQRNYGQFTPYDHTFTKELADAYLCTDGQPISVSPQFKGYGSLILEAQNRDPRFYQTISVPDQPWIIHADGSITYFTELYDNLNTGEAYNASCGYCMRKGYDAREIYHVPQYGEEPGIIFRYGAVLLNFAEAKAELGSITQADLDLSINKLRDRVAMPHLELSNITTDPNWDFPILSPVINEIRRERRVELASEGFRHMDICRWAAADELIVGKRPKGFKASQLANNPFSVDANGFLDPYAYEVPSGYGFHIGRDYLNAISKSALVLNPNLTQNPGWE